MLQHTVSSLADLSSSPRVASYALGPIDPASLATMGIQFADRPLFALWVPRTLSACISLEDAFHEGAAFGYFEVDVHEELEDGIVQPASLVHWVWETLSWEVSHGDSSAYIVGFVLGVLSSLAHLDRDLAHVGIAHLSFLLDLLPPHAPVSLGQVLGDAGLLHDVAVREYRARIAHVQTRQEVA